jgi:hypothetical protein
VAAPTTASAEPNSVSDLHRANIFRIYLDSCNSLLGIERVSGVVGYDAAARDQHVVSDRYGLRDRKDASGADEAPVPYSEFGIGKNSAPAD